MTTNITLQAYYELCQETVELSQQPDPDDALDEMFKFPQLLGQGHWQYIELQQGLELEIANYQLHDDVMMERFANEQPCVEYIFFLTGRSHLISPWFDAERHINAGQYGFWGSGMAPEFTIAEQMAESILWVHVNVEPELVRSLIGNPSGELPSELQRLIRNPDQAYSQHFGITSAAMQGVLQQILRCPYRGVTKRIYLQSKVWELLGLLIESTVEAQQEPQHLWKLKPEDVERIHSAKEILLQHLDSPPCLMELARQVGLNDYKLKRGFRQVFGTTAFGYLHNHRLGQARQLLETNDLNVEEVARVIGYRDRSAFSKAFCHKFGVTPSYYRKSVKHC